MNRPSSFFNFTRIQAVLLTTLFLTVASITQFCDAASAQTEPSPPGQAWPTDPGTGALTPHAVTGQASLINQAAEQNKDIVIQNVEALLTDNFRQYNETYAGLHTFGGDDIITNLFVNIAHLIGKWISEGKGFILAIIACVSFIPSKHTRNRSLRSISVRLICLMTLIGVAFATF